MRVVVFGGTETTQILLNRLYTQPDVSIVFVLSVTKEFSISYSSQPKKNCLYRDLDHWCALRAIDQLAVSDGFKDPNIIDRILRVNPDLVLVAGWYHMIPPQLYKKVPCIGFHASLLPEFAGGAPLVWALLEGASETGVSTFLIGEGIDSGPVITSHKFKIRDTDDIKSLLKKSQIAMLECLEKLLVVMKSECLESLQHYKRYPPTQIYAQRSPADGLINWRQTAAVVDRFVRAQTEPYPGAYFHTSDMTILVWKGRVTSNRTNQVPGTLRVNGKDAQSFDVACLDVWYQVVKFTPMKGSSVFQ